MAFNKVILVGNLTDNPELKATQGGVSVVRFSIAVNRKFTKAGEQPQTDFFNIVAWRQTAEFIARFFTKGRPILISGSIQNNNWTDNNGVKHYNVEVVAEEVTFVDRKSDKDSPAENAIPTYGDTSGYDDLDDDDELPFG